MSIYNKNNVLGMAVQAVLGVLAFVWGSQAQAQVFCVYDPLGSQGDFFSLAKDYQLASRRWGLQIDITPYTDDTGLYDAFKAGTCDMASMIGLRAREFNKFTGSVDAPGVIENYVQMRDVLSLMASPRLAKFMVSDGYEMVGMMPLGAAYPVVNDRKINSFARAAGKKVAVMGWDKTQKIMADHFRLIPVPLELTDFGPAFNSGRVDAILAPMVLFKAMELSRGIGSSGGVVRRPLFYFTMQFLTHADRFPADFGQKSREFMNGQTDHALGIIRNQEADVDQRVWIYAVHSELVEWDNSMRGLLKDLVAAGYYDQHMLSILKRIRCKTDVDEPECAPSPAQQGLQ